MPIVAYHIIPVNSHTSGNRRIVQGSRLKTINLCFMRNFDIKISVIIAAVIST